MERAKLYKKTLLIDSADDQAIKDAAEHLRNGEVIGFPTETVYGLGCDARNGEAVKKVFEAKGRPADNPLICHIGDKEQIKGIRIARQGAGHWVKEFEPWDESRLGNLSDSFLWQHYRVNLEEGEKAVFMRGTFVNDDKDADQADHLLLEQGWITITPLSSFMTDKEEFKRLKKLNF